MCDTCLKLTSTVITGSFLTTQTVITGSFLTTQEIVSLSDIILYVTTSNVMILLPEKYGMIKISNLRTYELLTMDKHTMKFA